MRTIERNIVNLVAIGIKTATERVSLVSQIPDHYLGYVVSKMIPDECELDDDTRNIAVRIEGILENYGVKVVG